MSTINATDVVNHDMYAKGSVQGYDANFVNITQNFSAGQLIGNVYSWIINPATKQVYWMFYPSLQDYNNFTNAFYVPQDPNLLSLPDLPEILQHIADMQDVQNKLAQLDAIDAAGGNIPYYIEKYGTYAIVLLIAGKIVVPLITGSKKSVGSSSDAKKKMSPLLLLLLFGGGIYAANKWMSRKGSVIVAPLDQGSYVSDQSASSSANPVTVTPQPTQQVITSDLPTATLPAAPTTVPNYSITIQDY